MKYLITYDLNNPGQNYQKLIEAIDSLGSAKKTKFFMLGSKNGSVFQTDS